MTYRNDHQTRDERVASGYVQSDHMDRLEEMHHDTPERLTAQQRMSVGHYQVAREAADRVARGEAR